MTGETPQATTAAFACRFPETCLSGPHVRLEQWTRAANLLCVQIHVRALSDHLPWRETMESKSGFLRGSLGLLASAILCSEREPHRSQLASMKSHVRHADTSRLRRPTQLPGFSTDRRCLRQFWLPLEFRS